MTTYDHVHGFVRIRQVHPLLIWLAMKIGWGLRRPFWRFVVQSGELPHDPECTPTTGVLRQEGEE